MKVVDVCKELDALLPHCSDVEHYVGFALVPNAQGQMARLAFARIVFQEDGPFRELPPRLTCRRAFDVSAEMEMLIISAPDEPWSPLLATEWTPDCTTFFEGVQTSGLFLLELLSPSMMQRALVAQGEVKTTAKFPITPDRFQAIRESHSPPPGTERPS